MQLRRHEGTKRRRPTDRGQQRRFPGRQDSRAGHSQPRRLNSASIPPANTTQTIQKAGYAQVRPSSGKWWKFIPYTPARNVSGIKMLLMIVSTFMISFMRLETEDM